MESGPTMAMTAAEPGSSGRTRRRCARPTVGDDAQDGQPEGPGSDGVRRLVHEDGNQEQQGIEDPDAVGQQAEVGPLRRSGGTDEGDEDQRDQGPPRPM